VVQRAAYGVVNEQSFGEWAIVVRANGADGEDSISAPRQQHGILADVPKQHLAVCELRCRDPLR
jgi:hypothetical protein